MKINKKLLIPVFATAMGLSVVGGVSGAVAWYQYNTKVTGSWMGVTTSDGGVLQIKDKDGKWKRDASYGAATDKLHPITFGGIAADEALPEFAYKHPEAGVAAMTSWDKATAPTSSAAGDYVQFEVELQTLKLVDGDYVAAPNAEIKLEEMIIECATDGTEVGNAVRVHLSDGTTNVLYSINGGSIDTHGYLDLDRDEEHLDDTNGGYIWAEHRDDKIDYGDDGSQTSNALPTSSTSLFATDSNGLLTITVTIWLEGWQKLNGSAIWDATTDSGATIHFGMKLSTPKASFLED